MRLDHVKDIISMMLRPIRNRVYSMITRAVIQTVNDSKNMQIVQVGMLAGESRSDVERFQNFGFTSNPPAGSEALALSVGGNRDHLIIIAADDRKTRFKPLASGESAVFTDDGTVIHLKKGGTVEILAATKVDINSPTIELGTATLEKILNGETFQARYNAHTQLGNLGVPTGTPIVQSPPSDLSSQVKGSQ